MKFKNDLSCLTSLSISRYILPPNIIKCHLLGFCDASEAGYAAAIYLRVELSNNVIESFLVVAKSKVAPLNTISIPRLELLGSVLLADLYVHVLNTYSSLISVDKMYAFSDSEVVLNWLSSSPHKWKTFVANRVSHVQRAISQVPWFYVKTDENPVDCVSRGLTPQQLLVYDLWFQGPPWIIWSMSKWSF